MRLRDCGILGNSGRLSASISSPGIWLDPPLPHRLLWEDSKKMFMKHLGQAWHLGCYTVSTAAGSPLHVHVDWKLLWSQSTTHVMRRVKTMQGVGGSERKEGWEKGGKEERKDRGLEGEKEGRKKGGKARFI